MNRSALALATLLFVASPALADWPTDYTLVDATGANRGSLTLEPTGKSLFMQDAKFDVRLTLLRAGQEATLLGTVQANDDMLSGTLVVPRGAAGGLSQHPRLRTWRVRIGQGLRNRVILTQRSRRIELQGRAGIGKRNAANEALIRGFYEAFQRKDAAAMASAYAPNVHFSDRVFPNLHGSDAGAMWAMLCEDEGLKVTFSGVQAGDRYGVARWEAVYELFGNRVHNVIDASFEIADGKIVRHVDQFDFDRWARQALPTPRKFLGTTSLRTGLRAGLHLQLKRFIRGQKKKKQAQKPAPKTAKPQD